MKGNTKTTVIVLLVGLVLVSLIYFINQLSEDRYNWYESYDTKSDQPYGMEFMQKLLPSYFPGSTIEINKKKNLSQLIDNPSSTLYFFIGHNIYLNEADEKTFLEFIQNGGTAFISTNTFPSNLIADVYSSPCVEEVLYLHSNVEKAGLNFYHPDLHNKANYLYRFRENNTDRDYFWKSLDASAVCELETSVIPLGYIVADDEYVNFFKIGVGEGFIYFHSNPVVFTNYFLTKKFNIPYTEGILSHFHAKSIIWDEKSKVPLFSDDSKSKSPLYFILQQPSLKYAWWLFLLSVVLYLIFAAKRKQREIPVLEKKNNTSLEYVRMVAALHFQNGNHLDIARKKMKYFLYFIRQRYGIQLSVENDKSMQALAQKSNVSKELIEAIARQFHLIDRYSYTNIESDKLSQLYFAIDQFYKSCK
jgi:hypothetical protein